MTPARLSKGGKKSPLRSGFPSPRGLASILVEDFAENHRNDAGTPPGRHRKVDMIGGLWKRSRSR